MAVKDFDPDCGDSAYTMGIVDLLLECVELSYRPGKYGLHQYKRSKYILKHILHMENATRDYNIQLSHNM